MIKIIKTTLLLSVFALSLQMTAEAAIVDKIIAVVNDTPITQSELETAFAPIYQQYVETYRGVELKEKLTEARIKIVNQLIEDRLVYQEAVAKGITVSEAEVNQKIREVKERYGSEEAFRSVLKEQGITLKALRSRYEEQIAIRRIHQYQIISRVIVSPQDVEQYYNDHLEKFTRPQRAKVRTIMLKKDPSAKDNSPLKDKLRDILVGLGDSISFADLATEYSDESHAADGGLLGFINKGEMMHDIDEAIFNAKIGEVTDIVESPLGYHVFYVEGRQEKDVQELSEVKDSIERTIFANRSEARFAAWIKELKEHAYISIK